ncbi:DnaB-like helicase N-terminal domain-containing protein [Streptomyces sp. 2314.4]|uniref:DnaB-like helicase N-terminal domain-containing protein n=1 Tax=Streptomyces sp. 2314.4 TaxID=1881025 RepID=UPI0008967BC5|nr:DnaB-like helicase N-terminal domain-containing protein [Streptomyces sp. 2314.4]SEC12437.1 DnaB-like helicase N terminal domain-containing protein [Streptomyces sp. 2314.4]
MTPLVQAEQAVLGSVFLDPGQLDRLSPWLRPGHFSRPAHAAIYAAMLKLRADSHPAAKVHGGAPVPMSWLTDTVSEASKHTRGLTASYAHALVSACPRPEHAVVYGRMVLEGAIHRGVAQHATRLHQAARADAIRGGAEETVHHAEVLSEVLADLARRWGTKPQPVAPPSPATPTPAHPQPVDEQLLADEEFLLGCLSARPQKLDEVVGWLHPGDFAEAGHQQIYRSLGALHHRGEPIDQLTVLWETQRRGALADRTLDAERVLRICDPSAFAGSAEYFGEQVVQASLVRTAAASARQVRTLADDESLAPGRLIGYALHALGPLEEVRRRWRIATGAEPKPPRAGHQQDSTPPAARIDAARSRSRPHRAAAPPVMAPTTASPPPARDRHHRRSPS